MKTFSVQQLAEAMAMTDILLDMFGSMEVKDPRVADAIHAMVECRAAFPEWEFHRADTWMRSGGFDFGTEFEVKHPALVCDVDMTFPTDMPALVRDVEIVSVPAITAMIRVGAGLKFSTNARGPRLEHCWTVVQPREQLHVAFELEPGVYRIDDVIVRAHVLGKR